MGNINTVGPNEALVISGKVFLINSVNHLQNKEKKYPAFESSQQL